MERRYRTYVKQKDNTILLHWLCFLLIALLCTLGAHNLSRMKSFVHRAARKRFLIQDPSSCISGFISKLSNFSTLSTFIPTLASAPLKRDCCAQLCYLYRIMWLLTKALLCKTAERDTLCKTDCRSRVTLRRRQVCRRAAGPQDRIQLILLCAWPSNPCAVCQVLCTSHNQGIKNTPAQLRSDSTKLNAIILT